VLLDVQVAKTAKEVQNEEKRKQQVELVKESKKQADEKAMQVCACGFAAAACSGRGDGDEYGSEVITAARPRQWPESSNVLCILGPVSKVLCTLTGFCRL